jgi:hypothetical protein
MSGFGEWEKNRTGTGNWKSGMELEIHLLVSHTFLPIPDSCRRPREGAASLRGMDWNCLTGGIVQTGRFGQMTTRQFP